MTDLFVVRIEFLRVQTFLFAVPRLRDMVGANVLLGEMVRVRLPELAIKNGSVGSITDIPANLNGEETAKLKNGEPKDPLSKVKDSTEKVSLRDDPQALYKQGILARDGGHFSAVFKSADNKLAKDKALAFKNAAEALLLRQLPGLRFEIQCGPFGEKPERAIEAHAQSLLDLPQFQVCQESGNGPASFPADNKDNKKDKAGNVIKIYYSAASENAKKVGGRFFGNKASTLDIVGLLSQNMPLFELPAPKEFKDLCGDDYMAVIHADGNNVGGRYKEHIKKAPQDLLEREAHGENFFHSMRVAVRRAVMDALHDTFIKEKLDDYSVRPYQILMLGGDDLLMVCRAKHAFNFLVNYAEQLTHHKLKDDKPLTIGAGVMIASHSLPFHHLHHLAEELASSAKRLYRGYPENAGQSVVDWMVSTNAWADDPIAMRQRDSLIHYTVDKEAETLLLTRKPYPILGGDLCSLQSLVKCTHELGKSVKDQKAARSQLRDLVQQLSKGRCWADLEAANMEGKTRDMLMDAGIWRNDTLWRTTDNQQYYTLLADLVELYEIQHHLAREEKPSKGGKS